MTLQDQLQVLRPTPCASLSLPAESPLLGKKEEKTSTPGDQESPEKEPGSWSKNTRSGGEEGRGSRSFSPLTAYTARGGGGTLIFPSAEAPHS
jgi:hypothetical protein